MELRALSPADLPAAAALLARAMPGEGLEVIAGEKLFGTSPAPLEGWALAGWEGDELVAVASGAGRWIRLVAVDPTCQRRGLGSQLLDAALALAHRHGPVVRLGDQPGNYFTPGVDERLHGALELFEKRGFRWRGAAGSMTVPLAGLVADPRARRATLDDAAELAALATSFSPAWAFEAARALAGGAVWLVHQGGRAVGFACTDGNNQGLGHFGPMGVLAEHRGQGLGAALTRSALAALPGTSTTIAWVGQAELYERCVGASLDRHYVLLEHLT